MAPDQVIVGALSSPDMRLGVPPAFPAPATPRRLLWVDDSHALLSLYKAVFERLGFEVVAISSPREALDHLASGRPDVAILDYDMPEMDGGELASLIKHRLPALPVILYTGSESIPGSAQRCVDAICAKTAPRQRLIALIEHFLGQRNQPAGKRSSRQVARLSNC